MELYVVCLLAVMILAAIIIQGIYCGLFCFYPIAPGVRPLIYIRPSTKSRKDVYDVEVPLEKVTSMPAEEEKEKESQTDV
ncbi:uncharacterized protein [Centruroides vittatus]|uniref:uncharacterized protein n=1 Tax=Centruroides vittatus TaxID=120091 RepID=UPI00350F72AF